MMAPSDRELLEVELVGVGVGVGAGGSSYSGDDEEDAQPLLAEEGRALPEEGEGATGVYPLPSASYSRDGRGWGSKLVFSWIQPVLEKSRGGNELQLGDTLLLPTDLTAAVLSERFQRAWGAAVSSGGSPLIPALRALFLCEFVVSGVFRLVAELAKITSPLLLRELILYVKNEAVVVPNTLAGGVGLAMLLLALVLLQKCTLQHFIHGVFMVGAGVNSVMTVAVYDKSLRLSRASLEGPRLGQALNFQAKDASKLREFIVFFHNLWAAPLTAAGCTVLLLHILGPSALVGVAVIPILIPLETWVARRSAAYRKSVLKVSDARISLVGEIVDGIKTVKLNSLDAKFRARVEALRTKELASIRQALTLNAYNQAVMRSSPIIVALATFAAYVISGHELDAETAFTSLALFGTIAHPFHVLPKAVQLLADAKVSLQRLEKFLLESETERLDSFTQGTPAPTSENAGDLGPKIVMRNASFGPAAGDPCLEQVSAEMGRGLSVIVGNIGSGKSTLLHGLVEHLPVGGSGGRVARKVGEVRVEALNKRVAFCPDSPWIVNASARDNVCLGSSVESFDEALYRRCIAACALEEDFGEWPEGDLTVIGAKGITVSGGQKARISLARAMYSGCAVVLLDDPLLALDNIVGNWVFKRAVCEMARDAAVVMATHQRQYMREEGCKVFAISNGRLRAEGEGLDSGLSPGSATAKGGIGVQGELAAGASRGASGDAAADRGSEEHHVGEDKEARKMSQLSAKVNIDREKGGVSMSVYGGYLKACGVLVVSIALATSVLAQVVDVSKEVVLAVWSDSPAGKSAYFLTWYSAVCLAVMAMNLFRFFVVCWLGLRGSETLHRSLLRKVMGAPLPFFQVTESGRITSRFSSDFDSIDLVIPASLSSFMDAGLTMLGAVGVVVGTSPAVLLFIFPIAVAYYRIQRTYRMAAKELKRLDSSTKPPIFSHFQETLDGLSSVQAYGIEDRMRQKNFFVVDANMRARLTWDATNRWLGIRLDFLGALVVFLAVLVAVLAGRATPGMVGLGLSYALTITRTLSFGVRSSTALENQFNSVERVQQFIGLRQEEDEDERPRQAIPRSWPSKGLEMRDVFARHRPLLPAALSGVSLSVRCGERVGICGRSGSGKSTLALALVRVVDCFQGSILVDGVDVKDVPLPLLRAGVTVISQDAHLFSGNVREAVDPRGQCSDARIWDILGMVGLKTTVSGLPLGLITSVSEKGGNWSAGQRQLLCIARAMVNQPGVLVFDEATANVDAETDGIIQELIRSHLGEVAVIVIAHRLEDVVSCHRVVVMSAGAVAEEGAPSQLLGDPDSMLSRLAQELGPSLERKLREECAAVGEWVSSS